MADRRLWWRHLLSVLLFPATMTVFIPALIAATVGVDAPDLSTSPGLLLVTVAIGSPVKLVVRGPYRHVRNPMMTGVFCIQLGTAAATSSLWLLGWFALFFALVLIAIRTVEEPHLRRRFGADYDEYRRHVPRWIPQLRAWEPSRI